jgi:hypothetical protein
MTRLSSRLILIALVLMALSSVTRAVGAQVMAGKTAYTLPDTLPLDRIGRDLLRLERARSTAIAAHDTATLVRMYATDFRGVTAIGTFVDRAALLGVFTLDDPASTFAIDELFAGPLDAGHTTAILRGRLRTFRDGKQVGDSRYLHVYVLRDGRWQIVAAQGTLVRPAS